MRITHKIGMFLLRVAVGVLGAIAVIWCLVSQPALQGNERSTVSVNTDRLKCHVDILSVLYHPRSWVNTQNLDRCAAYIADHFDRAGARVHAQEFRVGSGHYRNVIGRFGLEDAPRLIIGAHYDSCDDTPGADDNASAVAALIELAYLMKDADLKVCVELVAYALEEPPFFRTEQMGSFHHVQALKEQQVKIEGVIVLEMIGSFSDEPFSQSYPTPMLYLLYPSRGNFIGVIGRWDQGEWTKRVKVGMKGSTSLPVYSIRAPTILPGVDFSDHMNYWEEGIAAVMVTDTAFYRNHAYHQTNDVAARLDYDRMSQVVICLYEAINEVQQRTRQ